MPFSRYFAVLLGISGLHWSVDLRGADRSGVGVATHGNLVTTPWASAPLLADPVALSFDGQGRLYVAETARRGSVDIDIRSHREWVLEDLANQSVEDLRRFFRRKMSPEQSDLNAAWLEDRNGDGSHDWKDLMEVKERVRRLEDRDGDGVAEVSILVHEGFNEEIHGVLAGVMPVEQGVLATVYPDLVLLKDKDGDGQAEVVETLFRGFGVHAALDGHDLHGLTWGPDGKIYFSVGDNGMSVTSREGRRWHYPNTGGVMRMNPDFSELEVFATGLRNVQEIAFDAYGNLFAVDNDGDLYEERERMVYIVEGSDAGWRVNWQFRDPGWSRVTRQPVYNPWVHEKMWVPYHPGQPAHITPALANYSVGPGGFKHNPGTALDEYYKDHFFLCQFPMQVITAFRMTPKGASFEMTGEHVFHSGLMASAINFGPDGAAYIADWVGKWQPNQEGVIYRVDDPRVAGSEKRRDVQGWLSKDLEDATLEELFMGLGNEDQRVRIRCQVEVVRRKAKDELIGLAADDGQPELARLHAIWGLGRLGDVIPLEMKDLPLRTEQVEVRVQAIKVAGDLRLKESESFIRSRLKSEFPREVFFAAMALGKLKSEQAVPELFEALKRNDGKDPFLRHALVMGLYGSGAVEILAKASENASKEVRIGAILALRKLGAYQVAYFLKDREEDVLREALRAIHDDFSIPAALPEVANLLEDQEISMDEAIQRRLLSANLRMGRSRDADRLVAFAGNPRWSDELRAEALECLGVWGNEPLVDRVEGRIRASGERDRGLGLARIQSNLAAILQDAGPNLMRSAATIVRESQLEVGNEVFRSWVRSPHLSDTVRIESLALLFQRKDSQAMELAQEIFGQGDPRMRQAVIHQLGEYEEVSFFTFAVPRYGLEETTQAERQSVIRGLRRWPGARGAEFLRQRAGEFLSQQLAKELELDFFEVAMVFEEQGVVISNAWSEWRSRNRETSIEERFRMSLWGGDPERGREIYRGQVQAQCVRCHEGGAQGGQVGPSLKGVGVKLGREGLLEALIHPSRRIAEGFSLVLIEMKNGEEVSGFVRREDAVEVVVRDVLGEERVLRKEGIAQRIESRESSMPPMGEVLTPYEVRDLIAYLMSWE